MPFNYDAAFVGQAVTCKSADRLSKYLVDTAGDQALAVQLYAWNTAISAAFYGPLQTVEVAIRNACHRELTVHFGPDWWRAPAFRVTPFINRKLREATRTLQRENKVVDTPHVVAALTFGFWSGLVGPGNRYLHDTAIWRPALRRAFPRQARTTVQTELRAIKDLRNRVAHHEPLLRLNISDEYDRLRRVLAWASPAIVPWMEHHSRVLDVLATRPTTEIF